MKKIIITTLVIFAAGLAPAFAGADTDNSSGTTTADDTNSVMASTSTADIQASSTEDVASTTASTTASTSATTTIILSPVFNIATTTNLNVIPKKITSRKTNPTNFISGSIGPHLRSLNRLALEIAAFQNASSTNANTLASEITTEIGLLANLENGSATTSLASAYRSYSFIVSHATALLSADRAKTRLAGHPSFKP